MKLLVYINDVKRRIHDWWERLLLTLDEGEDAIQFVPVKLTEAIFIDLDGKVHYCRGGVLLRADDAGIVILDRIGPEIEDTLERVQRLVDYPVEPVGR